MSRLVLLDTGVLGFAAHPNSQINSPVIKWLRQLQQEGDLPFVPEIADYELRRELIRTDSRNAIKRLDELCTVFAYLPLDTDTMRRAAEFWAQSRKDGRPLAHEHALDGDVILCAQAELLGKSSPSDSIVIATTNPKHFQRFVPADTWQNI